jgi:hypothetical protein
MTSLHTVVIGPENQENVFGKLVTAVPLVLTVVIAPKVTI